jgi:hypothetical protein
MAAFEDLLDPPTPLIAIPRHGQGHGTPQGHSLQDQPDILKVVGSGRGQARPGRNPRSDPPGPTARPWTITGTTTSVWPKGQVWQRLSGVRATSRTVCQAQKAGR